MTDPLRGEDGEMLGEWQCPDCTTHVHLHDNPEHDSHDWTRDFIREHRYVHEQQLEAEHNGDRGMLRLALKYPALHAAIIQVHGPATDLHPEHRAQILRSAGIADHHEEI
ncbi:hypothetical protein [Nocardia vaccinii]|uniref:hypothetical protein n=1 Tax=Nocardia vaccinii TaxID=1822 RepID=UPI000A0640BE|nr:hypothetical protein [Nocardia vaccinii]